MDKYDHGIGTATDLLSHYLKTAWLAAGLNWSADNQVEIEMLVTALIGASETAAANRLASDHQVAAEEQRFGRVGGLEG